MFPADSHQTIDAELRAFAEGKHWSWGRLARLLDDAERLNYWHEKGASFTEWLEKLSSALGVKPATLWRFLSAGRFYASLQNELLEGGVSTPPLNELPDTVSPENLELLSKLRRVAPRRVTDSIATKVLAGAITRADLRSTWQAYRPVLGGRTARGRGVAPPRIDTKDARKFDSVVEAEVFTGLKYGSKAWTGTTNPRIFRIYLKVKPEFNEDEKSRFAFDAVVAVRCKANDPLVLHGFDIRSALSLYTEQQAKFLELATPFCDRLWTAVRETTLEIGQVVIPHNVGILSVRGQALSVLRTATTTAHSGIRSADLAKGLLFVAPAQ